MTETTCYIDRDAYGDPALWRKDRVEAILRGES